MKRQKILLLPGAYHSPSARIRIIQFYPLFVKAGYDVSIRYPYPDRVFRTFNRENDFWIKIHPRISQIVRLISTLWILRDFRRFDLIITNRDIVPDIKIRFFERVITRSQTKLVIDLDDAIYIGERNRKMVNIFSNAVYIVVGNEYLSSFVSKYNDRISIIPSVVDLAKIKVRKNSSNTFTIGWMGSSGTTLLHLPLVYPALKELVKINGKRMRLLFVSDYKPKLPLELEPFCDFEFWSEDEENLLLNRMDVGLMPMPDNPFERGKCGFKAIQYMAAGIPALVSPVGANATIIDDGITGFHCNSVNDWVERIKYLIENPRVCTEMGIKARQKVEMQYSVEIAAKMWCQIFENLGR